jgi:acyl-CoA synthetase (AMP-forming)/AMP-acid ligase II
LGLTSAIRREAIYLGSIARTLWLLRLVKPGSTRSIVDIVEGQARKRPQNIAILYQDQSLSYAQMDQRANRYANWALSQGIGRGTPVALLMENRPDFICAWLGLFKVGAQVALININLVGEALAHSINVSGARHAIVGAELVGNFLAAPFQAPPMMWVEGVDPLNGQAGNLSAALAAVPDTSPGKEARAGVTLKDRAFFIYTSGTTGLPKAANFSHMRMLFMMSGFVGALQPRESDRIYDPLPLYHTTGGVCAVGLAFFSGGALILKRKFSVHEFWSDVHHYGATMFEYIGELCRYLLNAPPSALERGHKIRVITGNGLRPEIWREFQERFAIPRIVEFYGATESNLSMLNYDGTVGAVGRVPDYLEWLLPSRVVRFDVAREMPVRGADGLCIECEPGEVGEVQTRGARVRGLYQPRRKRQEDAARRVRQGRCVVSHRRSDAARRTWLFLFCRSHRRYFSLERRECLHRRSGRGAGGGARHPGSQCLWRDGAGDGRPRRHGFARGEWRFQAGQFAGAAQVPAGALCPADLSAPVTAHRRHRHLQAAQGGPGARRLRSGGDCRSAVCAGSGQWRL